VPVYRGVLARSTIVSWTLRVGTAAALGIDAAVHWQNASAYDAVTATIGQGELFRAEAVLAVAVGLLVLLWPRRGSWVAAFGVGASALAAVLLYRYVDVGSFGPLPDMYENTWQVPGKLLSAYAEGTAVVLAGLRLVVHRGVLPRGFRSRCAGGDHRDRATRLAVGAASRRNHAPLILQGHRLSDGAVQRP
jgi:hypothetical protein